MRVEDASILVRSMKGAAASMLLLMAVTREVKIVWEVEELMDGTSYSKPQVLAGRRMLVSAGLATKVGARYGLQLTELAIRQLPLPIRELAGRSGANTVAQAHPVVQDDQPDLSAPAGNAEREVKPFDLEVKPFDLPGSVVVVDQQESSLDLDQQQQQTSGARSSHLTSADEAGRRKEVFEACRECGIIGKKRTELVGADWVTADMVYRAVRQAEMEGCRSVTGMAITRLLGHVEPMTDEDIERLDRRNRGEPDTSEWEELAARQSSRDIAPEDSETPPQPVVSHKGHQTWLATLGEIGIQMSRPTFETWVKPAILVHYDPAENVFVVAVKTPLVKDWLERHLKTSLERSMAGITNRTVDLAIVTWSEWARRNARDGGQDGS